MRLLVALSLIAGMTCPNGDQVVVPPADGLLWGVEPTTGKSCPFVVPQDDPRPKFSHVSAFGKLDRIKFDGGAEPRISFDDTILVLSVTPLDAKNVPVAGKAVEFRGTGDDETGEFRFDTATRWDPKANAKKGAEVPFVGFPAGFYEVKVVAKIRLLTPAKAAPKADEKTEKRDALLVTTPFEIR